MKKVKQRRQSPVRAKTKRSRPLRARAKVPGKALRRRRIFVEEEEEETDAEARREYLNAT